MENKYTIANGYQHDAHVIYGDTDSVMVKFGVDNLVDAMALGKFTISTIHYQINIRISLTYFDRERSGRIRYREIH